jgi:hypothetical protein
MAEAIHIERLSRSVKNSSKVLLAGGVAGEEIAGPALAAISSAARSRASSSLAQGKGVEAQALE